MKAHTWEVEEVDGGPVGTGEFWICRSCGLSGGPILGPHDTKPRWKPFLAGEGLSVRFSEDCDIAKREVETYKSSPEYLKEQAEREMARPKASKFKRNQDKASGR